MATENKDFKVKHGLIVNNGGSFGGAVSVATPTFPDHATTKAYVDSIASSPTIPVSDQSPLNPINGSLWYDTVTNRVYVFYNNLWSAIANLSDAEYLQDHIHDTAIDGTGQIVTVFVDAGYYDAAGSLIDAGTYDLTTWNSFWDGGIPIDNFN